MRKLKNHGRDGGFSLLETVIALLLLMIASLGIISVLAFSLRSNTDAKKRYVGLLLAQKRLEDLRNTSFNNLTAGTVTETGVIEDGVTFQIDRTIVDNDLNTATTAPGPETKKITITVTPAKGQLSTDQIILTTYRMVTRPGPNRLPNS